jgi:hypothetical protein
MFTSRRNMQPNTLFKDFVRFMTDPQSPTAGKHLSASYKLNKTRWKIRSFFENTISILKQKFCNLLKTLLQCVVDSLLCF